MSTYAYDVVIGQLERATTQADVDQLVREYSIYVRGILESQHPSSEVTAERIVGHVGKDIGWLLGEISPVARARVMPMLPEQVQHPILGREFDVSIDELMLAGAEWSQGLPRGSANTMDEAARAARVRRGYIDAHNAGGHRQYGKVKDCPLCEAGT